jgi:DNA repair protein SbcC/Rad50
MRVSGLTSFRDAQEIDFSDLGTFAITGDTGSGKSSILDAMTFALFGRVDRVDAKHVKDMISQGQPRMAVELEFAVEFDRYRVTRSTPRTGATKIMLERAEGDGWTQYGEGADRVRDADAIIRRVVGLDYTAFTRSVLLPQGKFAEFLTGDPGQRRDILTELLGLSIFERMAKHANSLAKDERLRADTIRELLEREYAGVTAEAVKEAKREAKAARAEEKRLAAAGARIVKLLESFEAGRRAAEELEACAAEAAALADRALAVSVAVVALSGRMREAEGALSVRETEMKETEDSARQAAETLAAAEEEWGTATDLAALRVNAERLGDLAGRLARSRKEQAEIAKRIETLDLGAAERASALENMRAAAGRADEALASARTEMEQVSHADAAAALSAGLKVGDPCPVCGSPLDEIPKRPGDRAVKAAAASVSAAEKVAGRAAAALQKAERDLDGAARDLDEARRLQVRCAKEGDEASTALEELRAELATAFGGEVPESPLDAVTEREAALQGLVREERAAAKAADASTRARDEAERAIDAVRADLVAERARLEIDPGALVQRAKRSAGPNLAAPSLPKAPASGATAEAVAEHAEMVADAISGFAEELTRRAASRAEDKLKLFDQARVAAGELADEADDLPSLAALIEAELREAGTRAALQEKEAQDLEKALQASADLAKDALEKERRATRLRALATELRADRLIQFLQIEALQVLASAASARLSTLSDGRYRLICADDEFSVVDTWNGDEERSVRTLSGGETFLASLSLALALSEQVRSLSVTERAALDSLFLDEGFGTLDPETLRTVVDAIEQLGGDGRLVGVITHVRELAEQFPRLEVRKSPRGSTIEFVAS